MIAFRWALWGALLMGIELLVAAGCGKGKASGSSSPSPGGEGQEEGEHIAIPMNDREAAQWAAAGRGEPEELIRLVDLVGCFGLHERAGAREELRTTAIHALTYCPDFSELPWLVELAASKDDAEARAALETIDDLAARPRRATDPEDSDELHTGCQSLLTLARSTSQSRQRRVLAVRALRMLSEWGCVRREEIPKDLDVK